MARASGANRGDNQTAGKADKGVRQRAPDMGRATALQAGREAPSGPGRLHQIKFDGYRMAAWISDGKVTLLTRSGSIGQPSIPRSYRPSRSCGSLSLY